MVEKIDKVREVAGQALQLFFKFEAALVPDFAEKAHLQALFLQGEGDEDLLNEVNDDKEELAYLPWRNAEFVFQQVKGFFDSEVYANAILKGLITSSGGLTESTLKASSHTLFEYLSVMSDGGEASVNRKRSFLGRLIGLYHSSLKDERVTVPLMKTVEMLLTSEYISEPQLGPQLHDLHSLTVQECQKSKNIPKLTSACGVHAGLLQAGDAGLRKKAVKSLLHNLFHTFPKVRKVAS
eukprot:CAMPEP_0202970332 /NCGR_PEP_ID=MMETSP1396-20130829/16289_1 /ASSEMBLY_ACC=CAM_ASM_000872 /TAXON_ID= /ORGANISM="Pseudokeronopsis sp., Strain Brazil" /LENGTH=237 /DNA_ID=CAMNT_0049698747 /DNA_START=433 /DNA_END=1142 /DNA_ORIENTATION=+